MNPNHSFTVALNEARSVILHDLMMARTHLDAAQGALELLITHQGNALDEQQKQMIEIALRGVTHYLQLMQDSNQALAEIIQKLRNAQ